MLEIRTKIGEGGRIFIPSSLREKLHLSIGDEVIMKLKEGELHILTADHALKMLQEKVRKYNTANVSLVDTLLAIRKEDAFNE